MSAVYKEPFSVKLRGDEFGNLAPYRNGRPHRGQDWSPKEKSPIPAITAGTVFVNTWTDVLGHILIQSAGDGYFVLYAHLAEESPLKKGDKIKLGDVIGKVGGGKNTPSGSASTGAHLHLSIGKANKDWGNPNIHLSAYDDLVDPLKHILANSGH
jgi:murein DD-endopeptidase MepM/ murein hydrolase activator NlpD